MKFMFASFCNEILTFNQDISKWNTSNVTNMAGMFKDNKAFNQNLGSWDLSSVDSVQNQSLQYMLSGCGMSTANYDATLIGWAANPKTPKNVILGSSGLSYCAALNDRNTILVGEKKWKITSDFPLSNSLLTYHFDGINLSADVPVGTNFSNATWTIDGEKEPSLNGLLSFKPPKNGVYELTLIGKSGCESKMKTTVVLAILSTDGENTLTLAVYPNPTTNRLFVSFGATPKTSVSAVMTDNLGRKMLDIEENVIDDKLEISTERLPTGIYFLTIRFDGTEKTIKIVKE